MPFQPDWINLRTAIELISTSGSYSSEDAKTALSRAISDGAVGIRAQLDRYTHGQTSSRSVTGAELEIPRSLSADSFDWTASRPTEPWCIKRIAGHHLGYWTLRNFEVFKSDIELKFLQSSPVNSGDPERLPRSAPRKKRPSPAQAGAKISINALFESGVPGQHELPNKRFVDAVQNDMKKRGLPKISADSILRAAGRK